MAKKGYISASQIDVMNYCRMRYYLKYEDPAKPKPLRLSAYVKGGLLHELIETFWLYLDQKVYESNSNLTTKVFEFDLKGMSFYGFIDEIRETQKNGKNTVLIRDYKSGSPWWIHEMKKDFDPQLTIYNVGLCARCFHDSNFAKSLGLRDICDKFMGNSIFVNPDFEEEFFMIESPSLIRLANSPKLSEPKNQSI